MFTSHDVRFPEDGWKFRPMKPADIGPALDIIGLCDEDDRDWAEETYSNRGLQGQFVTVQNKVVKGVTGYLPASGTVGAVWLSWTYLHPDSRGRGIGSASLMCLFEKLEKMNFRKIFVSMSDYCDDDNGALYADALAMYEKAGFNLELQHPDYYAPGETQILLGRVLEPNKPNLHPSPTGRHTVDSVRLLDAYHVDETENVYAIDWEFVEGNTPLTSEEVASFAREQIRDKNIRSLFISVPDDHTFILRILTDGGFENVGRLKDFFQTDSSEIHLRMNA